LGLGRRGKTLHELGWSIKKNEVDSFVLFSFSRLYRRFQLTYNEDSYAYRCLNEERAKQGALASPSRVDKQFHCLHSYARTEGKLASILGQPLSSLWDAMPREATNSSTPNFLLLISSFRSFLLISSFCSSSSYPSFLLHFLDVFHFPM